MPSTAKILNPTWANLQQSIKKNTKRVLITGKQFKNGRVLMKTSAANSMIAKQPKRSSPTPFSIGCSKKRLEISMTTVQQPRYMMKKQAIKDPQIEIQAPLTAGLLELRKIRLCMPIQGKALNAQKNPQVRPQGVNCKNSKITAGDEMIVTQMQREVMIEATAQVNTIWMIPLALLSRLSSFGTESEQEKRIDGALIQISDELMISPRRRPSASLTIQLLNKIEASQTHSRNSGLSSNMKVQLSNLSSDLSFFSMRKSPYMPVRRIMLSSLTSVVLTFLQMEQNLRVLLTFKGVTFASASLSPSTPWLKISPTQSPWSLKLFSPKQSCNIWRSPLTKSSPMPNKMSATMASKSEMTQMIPQHSSAFQDLFDFQAIRNRCFYTYILFMDWIIGVQIMGFRKYSMVYRNRIGIERMEVAKMKKDRKCQPVLRTKASLTMPLSINPNPSAFDQKPIQEQYNEIYKSLSDNYLAGTALASYMERPTTAKVLQQAEKPKDQGSKMVGVVSKFQEQDQGDWSRVIHKFWRLGDIFEQDRKRKSYGIPLQEEMNQTRIKAKKQVPLKLKDQNFFTITSDSKGIRAPSHRPQTSKAQVYHSNHPDNKQNELQGCKLFKGHRKSASIEINRLKEAVSQLEDIAVSKFGMGGYLHRVKNDYNQPFEDFQDPLNGKMEEIDKKLRQIRSSERQVVKPTDDCSVPANFLRGFSARKSTGSAYPSFKKLPANAYIRV